MPGIAYLAQKCIEDAREVVQSIAQMEGKTTLNVYDADELIDATVGIVYPAVGVLYEGIRATERGVRDSHRIGAESELVLSFVLLYRDEAMGVTDQRTRATTQLDDLRGGMRDRRSPSGHYWRFVLEAPAARKGGNIMWLQRWTAPCILTR